MELHNKGRFFAWKFSAKPLTNRKGYDKINMLNAYMVWCNDKK